MRGIHNRKLKTIAAAVTVCLLAWLAAGCTQPVDQNPTEQNGPTMITLTPVDLFEGDKAKFKPFLGNMSGAFKLRYNGNRPTAHLDAEIWENGKKTSVAGSLGDLFFSQEGSPDSREIEVVLAIDTTTLLNEGKGAVYTIKAGVVHDTGSSVATFACPQEPMATMLLAYAEPYTFAAENTVPVWGIQGTRSGIIRPADLSPESLSQIEWGLIFTLRFDEPEM